MAVERKSTEHRSSVDKGGNEPVEEKLGILRNHSNANGLNETARLVTEKRVQVVDLDDSDDDDDDFLPHPSPFSKGTKLDETCDESPILNRCKAKARRNVMLMTQSTPKVAANRAAETNGTRRPIKGRKYEEKCSFIDGEADVSSDATCSEDEGDDHHDSYEQSFVDDLISTQHNNDE